MLRWLPILLIVVPAPPAAAGARLDGHWVGRAVTEYGRCSPSYDLAVTIRNARLSGHMTSNTAHYTVSATVDDGGRMKGAFAYGGDAVIKVRVRFSEHEAYGSWTGHEETRRTLGFGSSILFPRERDLCDGSLRLTRVAGPEPPPDSAPTP